MTKYEKIRGSLNTGDIVGFSGKGGISNGIKWFCTVWSFLHFLVGKKSWRQVRTGWSHLAMIVRHGNRILLYESTSIAGGIKGVRLVPFSQVVAQYEGKIYVRHLIGLITPVMKIQLEEHIQTNLGKQYETDLLELMGSAWDGWLTGHNEPNMTTVFCSELVSDVYIEWGLLPPCLLSKTEKGANEYTPEDYRFGGAVDLSLALLPEPHCLSSEKRVK